MYVDAYYYALNEKSFDWDSHCYIDSFCDIKNTIDLLIKKAFATIDLELSELCDNSHVGLIVGSSLAGLNSEQSISLINEKSKLNVYSPGYLLRTIQQKYGINGLTYALSNTCVTGIDALTIANYLFSDNQIDRCLLLLYDYTGQFIKSGLESYSLLSNANSIHPFDKSGKGIVLQGAAAVVLLGTDISRAKRKSTFRILSACIINDAYAISAFSEECNGIKKAITESLKEASLCINDITAIFCSTNGIYENDIRYLQLLDNLSYHGIISSIKHITKHTLGTSLILEMLVSYEIIERGLFDKICCGYKMSNNSIAKYSLNSIEPRGIFMIIGTGFSGVTGAFVYRID